MKKKILFAITTYQPVGGHYYSLVTTARALSEIYDVHIFNLGTVLSPIIEKSGLSYDFVYYNKRNFIKVSKYISNYVSMQNISIVHGFDYTSCFLLSYAVKKNREVCFAWTKCGGQVSKSRKIPRVKNIVVFSLQDLCFFEHKYSPKKYNLVCIPNRVSDFDSDSNRIEKLKRKYNLDDKRVILRIGRISEPYINAIKQSILLQKMLYNVDQRFALLIIGTVKKDALLQEVKSICNNCPNVYIETSDEYTDNSKELIDISDIVVGTGRGFMEACSKNKIMFVPSDAKKYPVLITESNFQTALYYNFSPRYNDDVDECVGEKQIFTAVNEYDCTSRKWYDEYFNAGMICSKYYDFYKNGKKHLVSDISIVTYMILEYMESLNSLKFRTVAKRILK